MSYKDVALLIWQYILVCSDSSNWKPNRIQEISKTITNDNIFFKSVGFFYWQSFGLKLEIKCKMLKYFSLVQRAVFSANRTSHFLSAEVLPVGSSGDINSNSKSVLTKLKYLFPFSSSIFRGGRGGWLPVQLAVMTVCQEVANRYIKRWFLGAVAKGAPESPFQ